MNKMKNKKISDLFNFIGIESTNILKSSMNLGNAIYLIHNLDILFNKTISGYTINKSELKIPAFLYMNVNRELYLSMGHFLRLHSTKAFSDLRCAIDSTLTAYYLLKHPENIQVYISNIQSVPDKEWKEIFLNIKRTIKSKQDEFPLATHLTEIHEFCSIFTHSDASGIMSRYIENKETYVLESNYFDYEDHDDDYKKWLAILLSSFLEIFMLFWEEMFKMQVDIKTKEEIDVRLNSYKTKLSEFCSKYKTT